MLLNQTFWKDYPLQNQPYHWPPTFYGASRLSEKQINRRRRPSRPPVSKYHRTSLPRPQSSRLSISQPQSGILHRLAQRTKFEIVKATALQKMSNLIMNLVHTSYEWQTNSRPNNLKNFIAQGSVLAPTLCLYNVSTYDFSKNFSTKYMHGDDVALTYSVPTFSQSE